ncbi:MAG: hypothetical protein KDN20_16900 [Verrucomicrobiae bacterium]|nr:hypothetical protein [Verrucomicrobiae bacterium]
MEKTEDSPTQNGHQGRDGLMFDWSNSKGVVVHIGTFLAASLGVHLFGFYLFQVVYPVTARVEPIPSRVRVLDPSQPSVSALMRQIDDRLVFLRPASSGSEARVGLTDYTVQFQPSFAGHELTFRRLPVTGIATQEAEGMGIVLPPVTKVDLPTSTLRNWRLGGGLSDRPVRKQEALDKAFAEFETSGKVVRLSLAVDRRGQLRAVLPVKTEETIPEIDLGDLENAVWTNLRFEPEIGPAPGNDEDWQRGWLEIGR